MKKIFSLVMIPAKRALVLFFSVLSVFPALARAQGITPIDDKEKARFESVQHALEKAGYQGVLMVGHGDGAQDALFALTAEQGGKGMLLIVQEPRPGETVRPVEIESDKTPADLGLRGVRFESFLGMSDLVDVVVGHQPFRLEISYEMERHHVLRRGGVLTKACEFDGTMTTAHSKGIGSMSTRRTVTVEKVSGDKTLQFDVKTVEETTEQSNQTSPATTTRKDGKIRYELPPAGICRALDAPK